ncbi:DNA (cytosine-5-)-methyltransferase [Sphingomonas antarctica]|uniref:DNA cytosine methyltransferase n=1 Tax=Sphingomonas antarctica TaxID=2040274 RepID=UPI0039E73DF3
MSNACFISLFSGAGGLDLGLEQAGWTGLYAADIDRCAVDTLIANRGFPIGNRRFLERAVVEHADVQQLTGDMILRKIGAERGDVPLLVGGPPCQSWSSAGRQRGFDDPRGQLFADFVRLAGELGVRWLMFENVRGLLTARGPDGQPGSALHLIRRRLLDAGFQTAVHLVNAADYGVPQRRVRLIVVGYRVGDEFAVPSPTHHKADCDRPAWRPLQDALDAVVPVHESEVQRPTGLLAGQMKDLAPGTGVKSMGKREATRPGGHWGYKQGAFVTDPSRPGRTVTASGQQDWLRDPQHGLRKLTARECAALQTFPATWTFCGKQADLYRLIGNAVPPKIGAVVGAALLAHCEREDHTLASTTSLVPLPEKLASAVRYTQREEFRNGASRRAAPDRRARKVA